MKKVRVYLVFLIICLIAGSLYAQETWKNYSTEDGLPANEIRAITEDSNGVKWFGTEGGGVARLDGETWMVYGEEDGLSNNIVRSLAIDHDGVLWCGTLNGVSSYDGKEWVTYTEKDGLARDYVISCAVDKDNNKWFGTYMKGVSCFDGTTWKTYTQKDGLADDTVRSITVDHDGALWFGTYGGVSCFHETTWTNYTEDTSGIPSNTIFSIAEDENNIMWFGTHRGAASFDGKIWKAYSAQTKYNILETRDIYTIAIDNNGVKWFGSSTGMWSFDGDTWSGYTRYDSGLKNDTYVMAIHTDIHGKKWIGSQKALAALKIGNEPIKKKVSLPSQMTITGNYPNPFNPATTIEFYIPENGHVKLDVYNIAGQKVRTLLSDTLSSGNHSIIWNGKNDSGLNAATGIYFFRLQMGKTALSQRMILMR